MGELILRRRYTSVHGFCYILLFLWLVQGNTCMESETCLYIHVPLVHLDTRLVCFDGFFFVS